MAPRGGDVELDVDELLPNVRRPRKGSVLEVDGELDVSKSLALVGLLEEDSRLGLRKEIRRTGLRKSPRPNPTVRPVASALELHPPSGRMLLHGRVDVEGHGQDLEQDVGLVLEEQLGVLAVRVQVRFLQNSRRYVRVANS